MKNYSQNKKAKEKYLSTSLIALLMCEEPQKIFTKEELQFVLDLDEREVRKAIAELANYVAVVSLSTSKGYRVLSVKDDTPTEDMVDFLKLIDHQLKDFRSRVTNIKARMKPLIALEAVIRKKLQERGCLNVIPSDRGLPSEGE